MPQAAGESCVDERKCAKPFCRVQVPLELPQAQRGCFICFCLWLPAEPYRVVGDTLVAGRFVHAAPQEQMDAPDTSGAESLAPQAVIEAGDGVFGQLRQRDAPDSRENVAVDQVAVSAHGTASPSTLILTEPAVTQLAYREVRFFLHMKIPVEQFRWYAAFHDEAHHPHLHMVCFSADGKSGYLNTDGIEKIKAGLAKEIFRQELHELYGQQTMRRNALTQDARELLRQITERMQNGTLENPRIEQLMVSLSDQLKTVKGKKQYGYLKAPLKSVVDEIVDELQKDARISQAYGLWYELRDEVLRTYRKDLPKRLPLSRQKEFRQIHNLVIQEAVRLGEIGAVFPPLEADEPVIPSPEWQTLTAVDTPPEQAQPLLEQLTRAAEAGQAPAQYTLGRLYRDGGPVEKNHLRSVIWLTQAAKQGDRRAMYALGKLYLEEDDLPVAMRWFRQSAELGHTLAQYRLGKLLLESGDAGRNAEAVRWLTEAAEHGDQYAQYALGKLYLLGRQAPPDHEAAGRWLEQSAAQGNEAARATLEWMKHLRSPSVLSAATRLLHHMSRIFQEQSTSGSIASIRFTDSKLRQRIREKKIAMGHKPDDHEDQEIRMS